MDFLCSRSPSPEPIYDQQGKRQNTREVRARRKIEEQRHQLVTELLALNPDYKAPADYKYVFRETLLEIYVRNSFLDLNKPNILIK